MVLRATFLILVSTAAVFPDTIFLKDGKVVSGKIESESGDRIQITTRENGQKQNLLRRDILRVLYKDVIAKKYVYLTSGELRHGFIVDENAKSVTMRPELERLNEEVIAREKILSISEKELKSTALPYVFEKKARASAVAIEGEFTAWQTLPLVADAADPGSWKVTMPIDILKKSEYEYRYIVDGRRENLRAIKFAAENEKLVEVVDRFEWRLGFTLGAHLYAGGYATSLVPIQPTASAGLSFKLPWFRQLPSPLHMRLDALFFRDKPNADTVPFFSNLETETLNFAFFASAGWRFELPYSVGLSAALGAGSVFQSTQTQGFRNAHTTNITPATKARLAFTYPLTRSISLVLPVVVIAEFDAKITFLATAMLGVEFAL